MSGLTVSPADMDARGRATVQSGNDFENELNSLRSNMDTLKTIWRGDAAAAFDGSYQEIASELNGFKERIVTLGENISTGATIMDRTEQDNVAMGKNLIN